MGRNGAVLRLSNEVYSMPCYVIVHQLSVTHALKFSEHYQKARSVVLHPGKKLDVFSSVLILECFVFLLDGLMLCYLFQEAYSRLVMYSIQGAIDFILFCVNVVLEALVFNANYFFGRNLYFTNDLEFRQVKGSHAEFCDGNIKMAACAKIHGIISHHPRMISGHIFHEDLPPSCLPLV